VLGVSIYVFYELISECYISMNILVTGGAGFIGSHLCEHLVSIGHNLTVLDDLSSGHKRNLESVLNVIDFYEEKIEFFNFNKLSNIDSVVHLAAQVSVPVSIDNFGSSSMSNLSGTIKVIDFCRRYRLPLVYASSSAVYGNLDFGDDVESSVDLLSPYATDKYVMELYTKVAYQRYDLSSIGLRFFNVYGPRQDPSSAYSGVISIFCDRLLKDKNITIKGGFQTRDFIYVKDVVDAIYKSLTIAHQNILCEHINVLTGKSISVEQVADMLIDKVGANGEKIYADLPPGDPKKSYGATMKMERVLGTDLDAMVSISAGLSSTVEYIR
jgi:UDP-glucose 4-epimerase